MMDRKIDVEDAIEDEGNEELNETCTREERDKYNFDARRLAIKNIKSGASITLCVVP
jgi:hypothetical protein